MPTSKHLQQGFTGGELSPAMYGRLDDQKYQQGLATCRNFVVLPQGPVRNRAGFAYVGTTKYSGKASRLIPFVFSSSDTMVLELGDKYLRVLTRGGFVPASAGSTTPLTVATPYAAEDVKDIHYAQSGDVLTLVHPKYPPKELRRYSAYDWRLVDISFSAPLPTPPRPTGSYYCGDENAKDSEKNAYTIKYRVTALKTTDEGQKESAASGTCNVTGNVYLGSSRISINWGAVAGAERYRVYKTYSGIYGYIGETDETNFVDNNIAADTSITPPRYDDPFYQSGGITSVNVTNGGSGYVYVSSGVTTKSLGPLANRVGLAVYKLESGSTLTDVKQQKYSLLASSDILKDPPHWTRSAKGSSYPSDASVIAFARQFFEVVDTTGGGSGATVTAEFAMSHKRGENSLYTTATLKSITVTSSGKDYVKPVVYVYGQNKRLLANAYFVHRFEYDLSVGTYGLTVEVDDSTGSGAELVPVVSNGVVTAVTVRSGGAGYTNPTIRFVATGGGSGATATATVGRSGDYPGAVSYFEQRRIFAGTDARPLFVWMTRPATESDMSYTLPTQKDNRIKFRVAALQASRIRHLVPLSSLILLTTGAEFRVTTANDDTLTPNSIGVKPQSYVGASNVTPLLVNSSIIYPAERGGHVWELGYNWQASGFVTGDMCLRAAHLFDTNQVVDMALSKAPHPIVWCAMKDGSLLGCTYVPEQGIGAWHRHDTKDGAFESIACVSEGDEDILYAVIRRTLNGKTVRTIERMHEREGLELEDSFFVDCGIEDRYETAQNYVSGLEHLEGHEVAILADGKVMPRATVKEGQVRLPDAATHVIVGLPIESDLKTLPVAVQTADGGYAQGAMKNVVREYVRVYRSSAVKVGPSFDKLYPDRPRRFENYGSPPALKSEDIEIMLSPKWDDSGAVCIRQEEPLPIMVTGLVSVIAT